MDSSVISILLGALGFGAGAVVGSQYQKKQDEELYSQRIERRVMEVNNQYQGDLQAQIEKITQEYEAKLAAAQTATAAISKGSIQGETAIATAQLDDSDKAYLGSVQPEITLLPSATNTETTNTNLSNLDASNLIPAAKIYSQGNIERQMRDSQPQVRATAAAALGQKLSRHPQSMTPHQLQQLGLLIADHDPTVAVAAVNALGQIHDERVIPYLIQANQSAYAVVVKAAGKALQRYKTMAVPKVMVLEPHPPEVPQRRQKVQFRPLSAYGLGAISLDSISAELPVVEPLSQVSIANDHEIRIALQVARIAGWGDSQQVQYVPSLLQYAQSPNVLIRKEVATSLAKIAHHQSQALAVQPVIETLGRLSRDRRVSVRYAAILALGKLQTKAVIPYLQQAQSANDSELVKVAAQALGSLQPLPEVVPSVVLQEAKPEPRRHSQAIK
ncbi:MAG: HEAT repeat domain-containing protein [Pseudanabaena sp. ELA607]